MNPSSPSYSYQENIMIDYNGSLISPQILDQSFNIIIVEDQQEATILHSVTSSVSWTLEPWYLTEDLEGIKLERNEPAYISGVLSEK